jgi:hypothetical protein
MHRYRRFIRAPRGGRPRPIDLLICWFALVVSSAAIAEERPLPEPLTLQAAMAMAAEHPRVRLATAAAGDLPPPPRPLFLACHDAAFDGARTGDWRRNSDASALLTALAAQQLEIMRRYFDVLLADLSYMRDNEAMAVGYIQFDRAEARRGLGQRSPLEVSELEAAYQLIRRQRAASDAARRVTRSMLAQALNTPETLPKTLIEPSSTPATETPALDDVVTAALADNPKLMELGGDDPDRQALVTMSLRQRALELLERLALLGVAAEQTRIVADWRDLKLDQSRTLYEMEVTADLGYSMSQQTKARRDELEVQLCQTLTRAELAALQGKALLDGGSPQP